MDDTFVPVIPILMRRCSVCSAATDDPKAHTAWRERVRDAITYGMPVVDLVDEDQ